MVCFAGQNPLVPRIAPLSPRPSRVDSQASSTLRRDVGLLLYSGLRALLPHWPRGRDPRIAHSERHHAYELADIGLRAIHATRARGVLRVELAH